jgi:hypothetical protein
MHVLTKMRCTQTPELLLFALGVCGPEQRSLALSCLQERQSEF